jgi:hypothetical protein
MDLDSVADELYAVLPQQFVARRAELVTAARAEGDRPLAAAIGALRRPTVAAWAVNLVARDAPDDLAALLELGERLRSAQDSRDGAALRQLSTERREQIAALTAHARRSAEGAGQQLADTTLVDVQNTLTAAVSDVAAGQAVRSGRLTTGLTYSGFGEVDLTDAVALPGRPLAKGRRHLAAVPSPSDEPAPSATTAGRAEPRRLAERAAAQSAVAEAETDAQAAAEEMARRTARADEARSQRDELAERLETLRAQLASTQDELRTADRELRAANRARDAAERGSALTQKRLAATRAVLDRTDAQ